jgi:O-Antigen ligase
MTKSDDAVLLLQVFALAVMVIPSTTVIAAVGAAGYPASLIGVFICLVFLATSLFGFHDPTSHRHPIQAVLCVLWFSVLASYILMNRGALTEVQLLSADRMLILAAVITGVALMAAEWLDSLSDVRRVLRALCWGAAFCGVVAAFQYFVGFDLSKYLRQLPGFTANFDVPGIVDRGGLNRVTGTATTAIELGVVAGMLLPIAIYLGMYDRERSPRKRWAPVPMIALGVATSISRSGIISVVAAFVVLLVLMPPVPRLAALCAVPFALAAAFMAAHGLVSTLVSFFSAGESDPSIEYRLHDYPLAESVWREAPWFGHGGGTWLPVQPIDIFDNQYLNTAVELGVVGLVALMIFLLLPAIIALLARSKSRDPELRMLCAALAGSGLAATLCSLTFDSLSFPMFTSVYALIIGLTGFCWRLATAEGARAPGSLQTAVPTPTESRSLTPSWPGRAEV